MELVEQTNLDIAIREYVNRGRTGKTVNGIIKETGVSLNRLYSGLRDIGLLVAPKRKTRGKVFDGAIKMYFEREKLGLTVEEVAKANGVSVTVLYDEIRNRGYKLKTCGRKFEQKDLEEAISLFLRKRELGLTGEEIAKRTGVPRQTIYWHLKRRDLK
ncbi:TetR/AcrR family transcriptional regulator [Bacillus cereus]|uniref:TetR/AcrR family transcriptional regulator n=1 Tax=Bacillus cereus TaxID=1396 RepID=UPI003D181BA2